MEDVRATVVAVDEYPLPYYSVRLQVGSTFADARPGQFVMVQIGDGLEPYLRRAFSIFDVTRGPEVPGVEAPSKEAPGEEAPGKGAPGVGASEIEILAKIVGRGTERLSRHAAGESLAVLGPLGHGFDISARSRVALVAGGIGSAGLLLLGRRLLAAEQCFDFFYGGRSVVDLCRSELFGQLAEASGGCLITSTEDGSAGATGLITEPLEQRLAAGAYSHLYGCGPMPLLAALAALGERYAVSGEAALEAPMGCGFGACLGCAVPHVDGRYVLCCKDGPVFDLAEVRW